jgi:hypothetical protein
MRFNGAKATIVIVNLYILCLASKESFASCKQNYASLWVFIEDIFDIVVVVPSKQEKVNESTLIKLYGPQKAYLIGFKPFCTKNKTNCN